MILADVSTEEEAVRAIFVPTRFFWIGFPRRVRNVLWTMKFFFLPAKNSA
jgi:hypothetical protein